MSGKDKTDKVKKDDFQRGNLRSSEERLWLVRSEQIDRQQGSIIIQGQHRSGQDRLGKTD